MIRDKTDEILRKVPVEYRDVKRRSMRKVTKKLKTRESIKKEVLTFSNDVNHYAKNQMAMSFTDLYKASVPIILICAFVSLLFWEGKALSKREREDRR